LDKLYFNNNLISFQLCLNEFAETLQLTAKPQAHKIIEDIKNGYAGAHPELYNEYCSNLKKAVARVFQNSEYGDRFFDLRAQFEANAARFSAYKAYHATQQINAKRADKNGVERSFEAYQKEAQKVISAFNRYQVAEHNTAVARCRTAKQWQEFTGDKTGNEIFPYIMWLPSRSVTRREEHIVFYNKYWPKDSPFWNQNQPGNLWNCKCDWQETDGSDGTPGEDTWKQVNHKGLEGNPAQTGEIFSDKATYFTQVNARQRSEIEKEHRHFSKEEWKSKLSQFYEKTAKVEIENKPAKVGFDKYGLRHYLQDLCGDNFVLKNNLIPHLDKIIESGTLVAHEANTMYESKKANPYKRKIIEFFYFKVTLPNKKNAFISVSKFSDSDYRLYAISSNLRKTAGLY